MITTTFACLKLCIYSKLSITPNNFSHENTKTQDAESEINQIYTLKGNGARDILAETKKAALSNG